MPHVARKHLTVCAPVMLQQSKGNVYAQPDVRFWPVLCAAPVYVVFQLCLDSHLRFKSIDLYARAGMGAVPSASDSY